MTPSYVKMVKIYLRIYFVENKPNHRWIYTGITSKPMSVRMKQHDDGLTTSTRIIQERDDSYLEEIRYIETNKSWSEAESYEKTFKKYSQIKKLKLSDGWKRWAG